MYGGAFCDEYQCMHTHMYVDMCIHVYTRVQMCPPLCRHLYLSEPASCRCSCALEGVPVSSTAGGREAMMASTSESCPFPPTAPSRIATWPPNGPPPRSAPSKEKVLCRKGERRKGYKAKRGKGGKGERGKGEKAERRKRQKGRKAEGGRQKISCIG